MRNICDPLQKNYQHIIEKGVVTGVEDLMQLCNTWVPIELNGHCAPQDCSLPLQ